MPRNIVIYPTATTFDVTRKGYSQVVKYHDTEVVKIKVDGSIVLNTGGWETKTTQRRINQYAPGVYTYFKKRLMYVCYNSKHYPLLDGMTLQSDGRVVDSKGRDIAEIKD